MYPELALSLPVSLDSVAVLVPLKAFETAKQRLSCCLTPSERSALAKLMAERVLRAAAAFPVFVALDEERDGGEKKEGDVANWAQNMGAKPLRCSGIGLNDAIAEGFLRLIGHGFKEVVVAHADLPLASRFTHLTGFGGVSAVPDRHEDGTNVLCLNASAASTGFRFSYGKGSFVRHCAEAARVGLPLRVLRDPDLAWDIDTPADLADFNSRNPEWLASLELPPSAAPYFGFGTGGNQRK